MLQQGREHGRVPSQLDDSFHSSVGSSTSAWSAAASWSAGLSTARMLSSCGGR
jgi:hypothetical protein